MNLKKLVDIAYAMNVQLNIIVTKKEPKEHWFETDRLVII